MKNICSTTFFTIFRLSSPLDMFLRILGFESILSLINWSAIPGIMSIAKNTGIIFPVVNNFMGNTTVSSSVVPYIALTCALMPVKIFISYLLILRLSPRDKMLLVSFPSSQTTIAKKIYSTLLVVLLNAGFWWYVFITYGEASYFNTNIPPKTAIIKFHLVSHGGIQMWLGWSVMHLAMMALLLGLLAVFVDEWIHILFNFNNTIKE